MVKQITASKKATTYPFFDKVNVHWPAYTSVDKLASYRYVGLYPNSLIRCMIAMIQKLAKHQSGCFSSA